MGHPTRVIKDDSAEGDLNYGKLAQEVAEEKKFSMYDDIL